MLTLGRFRGLDGEGFSTAAGVGGVGVDEAKPFSLQAILIVHRESFEVDGGFWVQINLKSFERDRVIEVFLVIEFELVGKSGTSTPHDSQTEPHPLFFGIGL